MNAVTTPVAHDPMVEHGYYQWVPRCLFGPQAPGADVRPLGSSHKLGRAFALAARLRRAELALAGQIGGAA